MSWDFKPGMRVVCIDDQFDDFTITVALKYGVTLAKKGVVYTLRAVFIDDHYCAPANLRILLEEIRNPDLPFIDGDAEADFPAKRFRPLDESRLDVFRNLLVGLPKEEELA